MVTSESEYNDPNYQPGDAWEIDTGYDVFAADGEKVGDVQEVHDHYLIVSKGFFFPTERYVPVTAIADVRDERVSLNLTKDQIDSQDWDAVPADPLAASGDVPLREETVRVERQSVASDDEQSLPADAFQDTDIDMPVRGEEAKATRRAAGREKAGDSPRH